MTERVPSSVTSADILRRLDELRAQSQGLAQDALGLTETADRAHAAVDWGQREGVLREYDRVYATQLDEAMSHLNQGQQWVSSAHSATQFLVAATSTASVTAAITETLFKAPIFLQQESAARLDDELAALWGDDHFGVLRRAAWRELQAGTYASANRAAHSIRTILTDVLDRFAAEGDVKHASWWVPDPATQGKVTERQKIRFFLQGRNPTPPDDSLLRELERLVATAMDAHTRVKGVAHNRGSAATAEAKRSIVDLEEVTLSLLLFRKRFARAG